MLRDLLDQTLIRDAITTGTPLPDRVAPRAGVERLLHELAQLTKPQQHTLSVLAVAGRHVWVRWLDGLGMGLGISAQDLTVAAATGWITLARGVASFITPEAAHAAHRLAAEELLPESRQSIRDHIQELAIKASNAGTLDRISPAALEAHLLELTGEDAGASTAEQLILVAELARVRAA